MSPASRTLHLIAFEPFHRMPDGGEFLRNPSQETLRLLEVRAEQRNALLEAIECTKILTHALPVPSMGPNRAQHPEHVTLAEHRDAFAARLLGIEDQLDHGDVVIGLGQGDSARICGLHLETRLPVLEYGPAFDPESTDPNAWYVPPQGDPSHFSVKVPDGFSRALATNAGTRECGFMAQWILDRVLQSRTFDSRGQSDFRVGALSGAFFHTPLFCRKEDAEIFYASNLAKHQATAGSSALFNAMKNRAATEELPEPGTSEHRTQFMADYCVSTEDLVQNLIGAAPFIPQLRVQRIMAKPNI